MKLSIFAILILPALCFSQIKEELILTDAELGNLKGKVKQVKTYFYDVNYENDSLVIKPYSGFTGHAMVEFNYDKNGVIFSRNQYELIDDSLVKSSSTTHFYGQSNTLDSIVEITKTLSSIRKYTYEGDSIVQVKSKISSENWGTNNSTSTHIFSSNTEYMHYVNQSDGFVRINRFVYDDQNRMLRQEDFRDSDSIQELTIYMYPNSITRNPNKAMVFLPYNNLVSISNLEYEPNGNLIKIEFQNLELKDKEMTKTSNTFNTFEYKFDAYGNWLEKRQFFPSGKLKEFTKREILYFQ